MQAMTRLMTEPGARRKSVLFATSKARLPKAPGFFVAQKQIGVVQ
jgi:hypothetical protein